MSYRFATNTASLPDIHRLTAMCSLFSHCSVAVITCSHWLGSVVPQLNIADSAVAVLALRGISISYQST